MTKMEKRNLELAKILPLERKNRISVHFKTLDQFIHDATAAAIDYIDPQLINAEAC